MLSTKPKKKLARRQHVVSSWYLDNFCDSGGKLCVYERGKELRASVPRNQCVERDFHEFDLAGRKTSNDYEDWLSRIEGEAKAIIPDCRWQPTHQSIRCSHLVVLRGFALLPHPQSTLADFIADGLAVAF